MPWKGKYLIYCRIKYQVTRNTAATVEVTTISPKYAICARTYCHTPRNGGCARIYCLAPEYTSTVEFTAIQLEIRHLWSKFLPYSSKYAICARILCLAARNTAAVLEFSALQARNTAAALEFSALQTEIRGLRSNTAL